MIDNTLRINIQEYLNSTGSNIDISQMSDSEIYELKELQMSGLLTGSDTFTKTTNNNVTQTFVNGFSYLLNGENNQVIDSIIARREQIQEIREQIQDYNEECQEEEKALREVERKIKELQAQAEQCTDKNQLKQINSNLEGLKDQLDYIQDAITANKSAISQLKTQKTSLINTYVPIRNTSSSGLFNLNSYNSSAVSKPTASKSNTASAQSVQSSAPAANTNTENKVTRPAVTNITGEYNAEVGESLANLAYQMASQRNTIGYCLGGVDSILASFYGERISRGSAYMAAEVLDSDTGIGSHFAKVDVAPEDIKNLPAGAIIVWENGGGPKVSAAGKKHGHISIALGNGKEASDHIQNQTLYENRLAGYSVFVPIS